MRQKVCDFLKPRKVIDAQLILALLRNGENKIKQNGENNL